MKRGKMKLMSTEGQRCEATKSMPYFIYNKMPL